MTNVRWFEEKLDKRLQQDYQESIEYLEDLLKNYSEQNYSSAVGFQVSNFRTE
jgi:hypothetical protein